MNHPRKDLNIGPNLPTWNGQFTGIPWPVLGSILGTFSFVCVRRLMSFKIIPFSCIHKQNWDCTFGIITHYVNWFKFIKPGGVHLYFHHFWLWVYWYTLSVVWQWMASSNKSWIPLLAFILHKGKGFSYIIYGHSLPHYWEYTFVSWIPPQIGDVTNNGTLLSGCLQILSASAL